MQRRVRQAYALMRKSHVWISFFIAIPIVITLATGVLLMQRGNFTFIQPKSVKGSAPYSAPAVSVEAVLPILQGVPEAEVKDWKDVSKLTFSPSKGMYQARLKNRYQVQIDAQNASVLDVAYRRTGFLIELHQGSYFSKTVMAWVFFPASVGLFLLWLTGMYMMGHKIYLFVKRKKKKAHV